MTVGQANCLGWHLFHFGAGTAFLGSAGCVCKPGLVGILGHWQLLIPRPLTPIPFWELGTQTHFAFCGIILLFLEAQAHGHRRGYCWWVD